MVPPLQTWCNMNGLLLTTGIIGAAWWLLSKDNPLKLNSSSATNNNALFPMKEGDINSFVKSLQSAIIKKGGQAAEILNKAGGATGKFTEATTKALQALGLSATVNETTYRELTSETPLVRKYAYVSHSLGADVYGDTGNDYLPGYGYGRNLIAHFNQRTYLGEATGRFNNDMLELRTTINTQDVRFWVATDRITLLSKSEYDSLIQSNLIPKSTTEKEKLLKLV